LEQPGAEAAGHPAGGDDDYDLDEYEVGPGAGVTG
jgi:hypothetical protein